MSKPDHKAALEYAEQGEHRTAPGIRNLAAAYIELREKAKEVLRIADRNQVAFNALREILEET